ncbi:arginine--tRNA ligase, partial [Candidatus Woesearchaeota archaeon]|nr:arginine--tRNA ligase [Candidatus Woesearchaeota archaeon]
MEFKKEISKLVKKFVKIDVHDLLEVPPDPSLGDYALPCFTLAKALKKSPNLIASDLSSKIKADFIEKIEFKGPYLNFFIKKEFLAKETLTLILKLKDKYGSSNLGKGKKIIVEMSSPNIAKPFSIGHLRSTIIGESLNRILRFNGYKTIRINHLGDWGTQFGNLIYAYKQWGSPKKLNKNPITHLLELYTKFHEKAKQDTDLEE